MEFLDLCDDIHEIVINKLYKVRSDENLKHFEYIVRHALRTGVRHEGVRGTSKKAMPTKELSFRHARQYFLVLQRPIVMPRSLLISHKWGRDQLQYCFVGNSLNFKECWNRKQLCAFLLEHNVSHGMVGSSFYF